MNARASFDPLEGGGSTARLPLVGLLLVQVVVGYEWFMSGVTKLYRGGFPSGLADELRQKSKDAPGWYRSFLEDLIIPNASTVGYLTELSELLIGLGLIAAAAVWVLRWARLPRGGRIAVLTVTILASLGGTLMAVNFHLANGGTHPWLIAKSGFDEGIDLDSVLPAIQLVLVLVSAGLLRALRRQGPTSGDREGDAAGRRS